MVNVYGVDPVAWSIEGGRHRSELLRILAYASTGGREGVVAPGDCRVRQLSTAGQQIRIDTGAVVVKGRGGNQRNQSYIVNNRNETRLDTPTATTSARSHAVLVRVRDWEYSPWPKPGASELADYRYSDPYIEPNVPAGTYSARQLNLGYSAVMLARIDQPANQNNITDAMIKDVRQLSNPLIVPDMVSQSTPYPVILAKSTTFVTWPGWNPTWIIPEGVNWVSVKVDLISIGMSTQTVDGDLRLRLAFPGGEHISGNARIDYDPGSTGGGTREVFGLTASGWLPEAAGGGVLTVNPQGRIYPESPGQIGSNESSHMAVTVIFSQRVA